MSRLVTGEFSSREEAQKAIGELLRAGIPMAEIHLEKELPAVGAYRPHRRSQAAAEQERRNASLLTGMIMGGVGGGVCGLLAGVVNLLIPAVYSAADRVVVWPSPIPVFLTSMLLGVMVGAALGAAFGYCLDRTLTRMGAGPGDPAGECLVSVWANEGEVPQIETVLARSRARHVLAGIN